MSSMIPPAGYSITIPTGPAPDYNALIAQDPWYLQQTQWMNEDAALQKARLAQDKALAEQLYGINVQQANASANSGGDYGIAAAEAQAGLQRETATHDDALMAEYIREKNASKGMASSGQLPFEQQERVYDLNTLMKGIDIDLQARHSAASQARSQAQAGLALQLQEMQLRNQAQMQGYSDADFDITRGVARGAGEAAFDTYKRLLASGQLAAGTQMAAWDPASGLYKTSDGRYFDASGRLTTWQAAANGGGSGGGGSSDVVPYTPFTGPVTEYPPSRPTQNVISGAPRGAV